MWMTKTFKTREAMNTWLDRNRSRIQFQEIFVENAFGVLYRKLRRIY
jgi:hypothetical protein